MHLDLKNTLAIIGIYRGTHYVQYVQIQSKCHALWFGCAKTKCPPLFLHPITDFQNYNHYFS